MQCYFCSRESQCSFMPFKHKLCCLVVSCLIKFFNMSVSAVLSSWNVFACVLNSKLNVRQCAVWLFFLI